VLIVKQDGDQATEGEKGGRRVRADALRNLGTVVQAAREVFARSGIDAPMREIAEQASVGVGTIYRHFPQRADLIAAVFRREVDACAADAAVLLERLSPGEALDRWMQRYVDFIVAKRGLASSLYSGGSAYEALPAYFDKHLEPALQGLLDAAVATGEVRADARPHDLLRAVANLCRAGSNDDPVQARLLVSLLVDGLRYRASRSGAPSRPE
jgi:AcrR family transcriptional regulator